MYGLWVIGQRTEKPMHSLQRKQNKTNSDTCPIIWKVFIHDLPHLRLLGVKNGRFEVENDVEHGGLGGQGCAAVLRQRVRGDLRGGETPVGDDGTSVCQTYAPALGQISPQKRSLSPCRVSDTGILLALLPRAFPLTPTTRIPLFPSALNSVAILSLPLEKKVVTPGLPLVVHFGVFPISLSEPRLQLAIAVLSSCWFPSSPKSDPHHHLDRISWGGA